MNIADLKHIIEDQDLVISDDPIIFVCEDNFWLADQYITAICERKNLQKNNIKHLIDLTESALSLVFNFSNYVNVLKTDIFSEITTDYSEFRNTIVLCNKVDKAIEKRVKEYIIKVPKLKDWQILDYLVLKYSGVDKEDLSWLYKVTKGNIYRLENELDKLLMFNATERQTLLTQIKNDRDTDLFAMDYYELPGAIYADNSTTFKTIADYFYHRELVDLDPISLTVQLLNKYKTALFLVKHPEAGITFTDLGMSSGAAFYAKKEAPLISEKSLRNKIKFLSEVDYKLKSGVYDLPKNKFIDYIICNLMAM